MSIEESLEFYGDLAWVTCKNGVNLKGARAVIQRWLKDNTPYKGGWYVSFYEDDGRHYHFKIYNPFRII